MLLQKNWGGWDESDKPIQKHLNRTKVLVLGTGLATKRFILENQESKYIEIAGIILDESISKEEKYVFLSDLNKGLSHKINEYHLADEDISDVDVIFSTEYRRIIPESLCEKYLFINCHGGILPKWRGFSANAWAIMNGEKEIGFSIHRVNAGLDAGEIYYVKHIPIFENQTYGDVHDEMVNGIVCDVPKVLFDIANGDIKGQSQPTSGFAYGNKFTATMGDVKGFEKTSSYYPKILNIVTQ